MKRLIVALCAGALALCLLGCTEDVPDGPIQKPGKDDKKAAPESPAPVTPK